jgi:hypothetical protein
MFRKNRLGSKTGRPTGTNTFFTFYLFKVYFFLLYNVGLAYMLNYMFYRTAADILVYVCAG